MSHREVVRYIAAEDPTNELVVMYGADDRELATWSPLEAFELGAEWGRLYELLRADRPFTMPLDERNHHRAQALAQFLGRTMRITSPEGTWRGADLLVEVS